MADSMPSELDQLRRENARLIALLEAHGVAWRSSGPAPTEPAPISVHPSAHAPLSPEEKVALFRRLFRGRDNVYALRWQSNSSGRSGYAPACANERIQQMHCRCLHLAWRRSVSPQVQLTLPPK